MLAFLAHVVVGKERLDRAFVDAELLEYAVGALRGPEDLWPGDWRWATWEIVDVERARSLFEMGVDYVETMACDKLQVAPSLSSWCA